MRMPKLTERQIKAAISAREKEVRADLKLRKAMFARMQASRRQGEKVLTSYLKKTGFDFKAYDRIHAQQQAEMHRLLKEAQKAAIKRSSSRKKELAHGVENWRKNIERFRDATLVSKFVPAFEVVDTPFLIWPTNDLELTDSHIEPWNNTAKIRGLWRGTGNENLRFIFVWENPSDKWTVVNVESYLAVNGACDAFAEGGFIVGSINGVFVQASLNVWEWWNQPPTMLSPQATQTQRVLAVSASGGGLLSNLGGGSVDSASASGNHDLRSTLFSLPPHGVAVFEVALEFFYDNTGGGMIQANFASGDFGVKCPAVVIAVLS
jgi:hypothetical protein